MNTNNISWQDRYHAPEVYCIKCEIIDKPGKLGEVVSAIGKAGVNIDTLETIEVSKTHKVRSIRVFCKNKQQLTDTLANINALDGVKVLETIDQVVEIHNRGPIKTVSRVEINSITDLRMIYTPGVASICQKIEADPKTAWPLTGICDRVAIVTNGTAVLGLGDIGVLPSLPVMEGKAAIFAEFANISAVPVLIDTKDTDTLIDTVIRTAGSYGAIQLEDIAAPECFEIEKRLQDALDIPVMHDDQHGTATVALAALIGALQRTGRNPETTTVLVLGAGAAGVAITKILLTYGIKDIVVYDSFGPIYRGRTEKMNQIKNELAEITNPNNVRLSLAEGFVGRDVFIGVSRPKTVTADMVKSMAKDPIVFPMSNPVGEIDSLEALEAGAAIVADGRMLNNAQAYPGLFRGALDAHATDITPAMQLACAYKLAERAVEPLLLPDMLDRNIHQEIADAVADAWHKGQQK
ncbi:MAG: NAD-dependent malic enzyme [Sedimentisphaerales bacterium]|nr:NAD-dependent malic enzyme [Sedimentisphaerales bacterium]